MLMEELAQIVQLQPRLIQLNVDNAWRIAYNASIQYNVLGVQMGIILAMVFVNLVLLQ